jgi:hypothetical protein
MTMSQAKHERKPNFTAHEERFLVVEVIKRRSVLEGKFTPQLTNRDKQNSWKEVADLLNM